MQHTERPILFSAPMVRAILAGEKTMTRRVIKPQPLIEHGFLLGADYWLKKTDVLMARAGDFFDKHGPFLCPYGQPGDRLWVRETWCYAHRSGYDAPTDGRPGVGDDYNVPAPVWYRATDNVDTEGGGWKPSIFMPRWASRITLEVVGVRVERVQDISEADIKAEGVIHPGSVSASLPHPLFHGLWNSINGKRYPWESNPWVWVVEFKRITEEARGCGTQQQP